MKIALISLVPLLWQCVSAANSFRQKCLSFAPQKSIHNSSLTHLEHITAGTNLSLPGYDKTCIAQGLPPWQVVDTDLCRAVLLVPTSKRSSFMMEIWLPEKWKERRVLAVGNGGIDGCKSVCVCELV